MHKGNRKKMIKQSGRQKLKLSFTMIVVVSSCVAVVGIAVFLYANFGSAKKSKAGEDITPAVSTLPVDFNVQHTVTDFQSTQMNGVRVRKAVDINTPQE